MSACGMCGAWIVYVDFWYGVLCVVVLVFGFM